MKTTLNKIRACSPCTEMTNAMQIGTAAHQGAEDFQAGYHLNRYEFDTQPEMFRAWIEGYRAAKAINDLFGA